MAVGTVNGPSTCLLLSEQESQDQIDREAECDGGVVWLFVASPYLIVVPLRTGARGLGAYAYGP